MSALADVAPTVVSDTSPLNYLVLIGEIEILPRLYGRVLVPGAVPAELAHPATPEPVRQWIATPPQWLETRAADGGAVPDLDPGEAEAIALAAALGADIVLIDETRGRAAAAARGLAVAGTLGLLVRAAGAGLVSLPDAVGRLRRTSFQISEALIAAALERDRQRREGA